MIPIAKNITVIDNDGIEYEPTYLRRAKGLVKKGRAYRVGENKIALTDIISNNQGRKIMDNKTIEYIKEQIGLLINYYKDNSTEEMETIKIAIEGVTNSLDNIRHIIVLREDWNEEQINSMFGSIKNNVYSVAKTVEITNTQRETTKREIVKLLEKLIDNNKDDRIKSN